MDELAKLTEKDFSACVGDTFKVNAEDVQDIELELLETREMASHGERRTPFSILFRGPAKPILNQTTLALECDKLGELHLFLVPVGQDEEGTLYEAVFA